MKKLVYITLVILCLTSITGCDNLKKIVPSDINTKQMDNSDKTPTPTTSEDNNKTDAAIKDTSNATVAKLSIKDYYPFTENTKYSYEGQGNEYATYTAYVDYKKDTRMQLRTNNGGTETIKVLEYKDGELRLLVTKNESYYREDLTQKTFDNPGEILIKEPLVKETSWSLKDGRKRYISNVDVPITTPSGKYKALEITTENKTDKTIDYYAANVGLIKTVFKSNDLEVSSTLSKIESNAKLVQSVKFYYPNIDDGKIYYIKRELCFNTNDITKMSFQNIFKESTNKNTRNLTGPNVKINSLYLGKDNLLYVDFSKELVTEMNAGANYEAMLLQCIVNALGEYYGVNKVYLTVENSPYSSGHILKKKGEYFSVITKNSIELKTSQN
jgi:hypothetical protein